MNPRAIIWVAMAAGFLGACQQQPQSPGVKLGKPYTVNGKSYYPQYEEAYDRTGVASWYGPGFHGKRTASGEKFDQNDLTAAHPTLPMPSLVRVTNLENGRSLIVRVNDRGPFKANRLIDLSKASAKRLGIQGLARVRVQYLKPETETYLAQSGISMDKFNAEMQKYEAPRMYASNDPPSSSRIVESTVAASRAGKPVNNAAPVVSVSSNEIQDSGAKREIKLIKEAAADDTVIADTVSTDPTGEAAETSSVRINPNETITEAAPKHEAAASVEVQKSAPSSGGYIIRAGAFGVEQNAWMLVSKMSQYAEARVDPVEVDGKTLWRVHIGPFASREEAEAAVEKVRKLGAPDARVAKK